MMPDGFSFNSKSKNGLTLWLSEQAWHALRSSSLGSALVVTLSIG